MCSVMRSSRTADCARTPSPGEEADAARRIAVRLGYHPLAVEVAGSYIAKGTQTYAEYLREFTNETQDAVEFGARLRESLPTGHERSISGTLLRSIRMLGAEGTDFLRLASSLAVAPIPRDWWRRHSTGPARSLLYTFAWRRSIRPTHSRSAGRRAVRASCTRSSAGRWYHVGKDGRTAVLAAASALLRLLQPAANLPMDADVAMSTPRHLSGRITEREEAALASRVGHLDYKRSEYAEARELGKDRGRPS